MTSKGSVWGHQGHIQDPLMGLLEAEICYPEPGKMAHLFPEEIWISLKAWVSYLFLYEWQNPVFATIDLSKPCWGLLRIDAVRPLGEPGVWEDNRDFWSTVPKSHRAILHILFCHPQWTPMPPLPADDPCGVLKESGVLRVSSVWDCQLGITGTSLNISSSKMLWPSKWCFIEITLV